MWRYLEGVKQPPGPGSKKRNAVYDREYEKTKRQRTFRTEWASSGRTWLVNTDEAGMYCLACKSHPTASAIDINKKGNMVSGTKSYKLDTIVKHERSKQHIAALDIWNRKPKEESDARKIIMNLNKDIYQKLVRMFRNCHALISNCRPLSDFVWLCQLDAMKGLQMGETYRNVMSAKNFVTAIAHVEFRNIAKIVDEAKFLCVIGDGSTDTSIREQEMWFVRLCIKGDIKVYFIGVESAERADAEHIVSGLKNIILENLMMDSAEFIRKLVSLGCDGASVMVGCKAGVSALLKQEQPCVVTVHCMAHRLELCLKDAAKKVSVYDKIINTLLMGIYYFYYNSTLNRSMLLRTFNAIKTGDDKLLIPVKSGGTRWIGHQLRAITAVVTSYKFIVAHLEQLTETRDRVSSDSKCKAKAFLKLLKAKNIVSFLLFLLDVLAPLRRMSLILQDRHSLLCRQHEEIDDIDSCFKIFPDLNKVCIIIPSDGPQSKKLKDDEFQGVKLLNTPVGGGVAKQEFLERIQNALDSRISEFLNNGARDILLLTRIADIKSWPLENEKLRGSKLHD